MKNPNQERLAAAARQYHRHHTWRLKNGLYIPHSYQETKPGDLTWWDDVGFIHGGRRVIVWLQHPRMIYDDKIDELAWQEVGPSPIDNWILDGSIKNYRKIGRSRKKIVSYICREPSAEWLAYNDKLRGIRERLMSVGIEFEVEPSIRIQRLDWATGINLVAPLNVSNESDLKLVAGLAKRLITRQADLGQEFPGYQYGRDDWLQDRALMP